MLKRAEIRFGVNIRILKRAALTFVRGTIKLLREPPYRIDDVFSEVLATLDPGRANLVLGRCQADEPLDPSSFHGISFEIQQIIETLEAERDFYVRLYAEIHMFRGATHRRAYNNCPKQVLNFDPSRVVYLFLNDNE